MLLQDKYNIGALTINIEFMLLRTKQMEGLANYALCFYCYFYTRFIHFL